MTRAEEEAGVLYAVFPGYVTSKSDGQSHYIGARQLMDLYGVSHYECVIVDVQRNRFDKRMLDLIPLYPRYDGDYSVASVIQQMSWD